MVYKKNSVLNIDNQLTNTRTNHKYVNGYYNNLLLLFQLINSQYDKLLAKIKWFLPLPTAGH